MNICVFCAASDLDEKYVKPATELARQIAEQGHTLVWGGSDKGLMKTIAAGVQEAGGPIIGISMESLKHTARPGADEMIIAKDLGERKALMLERSDAIVTLVGGTGTLDELTDIFELKRHGVHNKPIVVLDTANFYQGLRMQYERMQREGFLDRLRLPFDQLIAFAETPEEVMALLSHVPETPEPAIAPGAVVFSSEAA